MAEAASEDLGDPKDFPSRRRLLCRGGVLGTAAAGKKLGRPKGALGVSRLDGHEDETRRFRDLGVPKISIAKITGVSRPTLYNFITTGG